MPAVKSDVLRHPSDQPKVKCFGKSAALTVEATVIQKAGNPPLPTINLEVAPRSAERVEWERKIVIQLSDSELPVLCAVLMGYLPELHLKRPGKAQCPRSCAKRQDFGSISHVAVLYPINGGYADIKMASDTANTGPFFEHAHDFPTLIISELVLAAKFHSTLFRSRATFLSPITNEAAF